MAKSSKRKRKRQPQPSEANFASLARKIFSFTRTRKFQNYLRDLLVQLCRVDTTPKSDVSELRSAEGRCFNILERELRGLGLAGTHLERRPINPNIKLHPSYSQLHFTKTPQRPRGLSAEATYAGRSNLVFVLKGTNRRNEGRALALNAHIDVVAPYFPPRAKGGIVYGRGACDDKGPVVGIVAALKVLSEVMRDSGLVFNRNVVAMFVVEEETGGNGSVSLATDRELRKLYDTVLVSECTGLKLHPANRGAVWYRAELKPQTGVVLLEQAAFVIEELEKEGAAIRAESRHALFPQRPVQTCHGIIGPFGEHPSRICGEVAFEIQFQRRPSSATQTLVEDCLAAGLANYTGLYGDKAKVTDAATGRPMVPYHCKLQRLDRGFRVEVRGATGHMGAIRERDGAITKMACLVRGLALSRQRLEAFAGPVRLHLCGQPENAAFVLEGGQGFVPTHTIEEVMQRMRQAAIRGAENYLRRLGRSGGGNQAIKVAYEKLHNAAFDGDPNSESMRNAIAAARLCRLWKDEPVLGWTVSCDARLFATEYPGMEVLTFGPGRLVHAHSDQEQIAIEEIRAAAEFLALFLLRQTGTVTN